MAVCEICKERQAGWLMAGNGDQLIPVCNVCGYSAQKNSIEVRRMGGKIPIPSSKGKVYRGGSSSKTR